MGCRSGRLSRGVSSPALPCLQNSSPAGVGAVAFPCVSCGHPSASIRMLTLGWYGDGRIAPSQGTRALNLFCPASISWLRWPRFGWSPNLYSGHQPLDGLNSQAAATLLSLRDRAASGLRVKNPQVQDQLFIHMLSFSSRRTDKLGKIPFT